MSSKNPSPLRSIKSKVSSSKATNIISRKRKGSLNNNSTTITNSTSTSPILTSKIDTSKSIESKVCQASPRISPNCPKSKPNSESFQSQVSSATLPSSTSPAPSPVFSTTALPTSTAVSTSTPTAQQSSQSDTNIKPKEEIVESSLANQDHSQVNIQSNSSKASSVSIMSISKNIVDDNLHRTTERIISHIPPPKWSFLPRNDIFDNDHLPNCDVLKDHFEKEGRLDPNDAIEIIQLAADILRKENNLLLLQDPITVCGDLHGQYFDLMKLLSISGPPSPTTKYLFLGDYVDRGCFGTEVTLLLLSYKIRFPDAVFLIRGNHECRHLTKYFNFRQECLLKYNERVYDAIMNCFDCLPLGALLNGRFLCVHGGLSPDIKTIEEINLIERFREPPNSGPMCDLLWSDPMDEDSTSLYAPNELRGCSYVFSYTAVSNFLRTNNLLSIIRAHEAQDEGYRLYKKGATTSFPTVICIFSAPNYCDVYNNKGAIIRFKDNLMNIRQFNCSPHPYYLPNFMNAFNWSMPFVVEKLTDMLHVILGLCDDEDVMIPKSPEKITITKDRADQIKSKIRAIGRVSRMYRTLREERESVLALKGLAGGNIPKGLLIQGPQAIRNAVKSFEEARVCDMPNEKIPEFKKAPPLSRSLSQQEMEEKLKSLPRVRADTPPLEKIEIRVDSKSKDEDDD